mgnify:CR=1 FL=1
MEMINWLIPIILIILIWTIMIIVLKKKPKLSIFPGRQSKLKYFYHRGKNKFVLVNGIIIMGGIFFLFLTINEFVMKDFSAQLIKNSITKITIYIFISLFAGLLWALYTWNIICKRIRKIDRDVD